MQHDPVAEAGFFVCYLTISFTGQYPQHLTRDPTFAQSEQTFPSRRGVYNDPSKGTFIQDPLVLTSMQTLIIFQLCILCNTLNFSNSPSMSFECPVLLQDGLIDGLLFVCSHCVRRGRYSCGGSTCFFGKHVGPRKNGKGRTQY